MLTSHPQGTRSGSSMDVLRLPFLGRLLIWRWGRLTFQLPLMLLAGLAIYDGFTGPQLAPENLATLLVWVEYRGLVILALILLGNGFCFACPFTLPRTLARRLSLSGPRWPRRLRNKWPAIGGILLTFWLYEWLDLWTSPAMTAWFILIYFVAAFTLESLFSESPFCKYVCPLGAFNFVYSTGSPLQITARDSEVCRACEGKECVNGSASVPGCGTELYVPAIQSNMDCTFCLDCARACPFENVALSARRPLTEWLVASYRRRWDHIFLIVSLAFIGLSNAFGMVPPMAEMQRFIATKLHIQSEGLRLFVTYAATNLVVPTLVILASVILSRALAKDDSQSPLVVTAARYAPGFIPMGLGIWFAHYGFHFAIGGLTIIPVLQTFLLGYGIGVLGTVPAWRLSQILPAGWIFPLQIAAVVGGFILGLVVLAVAATRAHREPIKALRELLPWALVLTALAIGALMIFNLPMEMRGTMRMT